MATKAVTVAETTALLQAASPQLEWLLMSAPPSGMTQWAMFWCVLSPKPPALTPARAAFVVAVIPSAHFAPYASIMFGGKHGVVSVNSPVCVKPSGSAAVDDITADETLDSPVTVLVPTNTVFDRNVTRMLARSGNLESVRSPST